MLETGRKNMPLAGKRNRTCSLLTDAHRERRRRRRWGEIKVEKHTAARRGERKWNGDKRRRESNVDFGYFFHMKACHRYADSITADIQHILESTAMRERPPVG